MVLSLNTMPGASMTNYASHGDLEISSYHQPCQMQSNLSKEIRAICTRMIARCTEMSATLNEWISTVDALIDEEENQLQVQTQEQAILKSSAIVDVPDIAIEPFHHPISPVRNCSVEVHCKRSVPNVIPNGESTKKLAIKKQTDEELLNQNLDSSSHSENRVPEQEISTMLNLVTEIKYLCHVRLNWCGIICHIQMVALPKESVEGRESNQNADGKSILVFDPGGNLFDQSAQTNIHYNDLFASIIQIQINFDLQIDFIRYSNLQLVIAITSGFLLLVLLCSEAMTEIIPATKFTLTVLLVGVEGAKGITLVVNFTALVEVSFELCRVVAHKNVMLLLGLGWSITANFTVSLINRWISTLTQTIEGQASVKESRHAKQLDLGARITGFLKSGFQDFRGLGKIEKEFAQSLEKVYSQHLPLIEYQQNKSCCPMFIRWFPALGSVLHFLKTKMFVDSKDDAYKELVILWDELETFGFDDLPWLNLLKIYSWETKLRNAIQRLTKVGLKITLTLVKGHPLDFMRCYLETQKNTSHPLTTVHSRRDCIRDAFMMISATIDWCLWLILHGFIVKQYLATFWLTTLQCFLSFKQSIDPRMALRELVVLDEESTKVQSEKARRLWFVAFCHSKNAPPKHRAINPPMKDKISQGLCVRHLVIVIYGVHVDNSMAVGIYISIVNHGDNCISMGPLALNVDKGSVTCGPSHGISIRSLGVHYFEGVMFHYVSKDLEDKVHFNGGGNVTCKMGPSPKCKGKGGLKAKGVNSCGDYAWCEPYPEHFLCLFSLNSLVLPLLH